MVIYCGSIYGCGIYGEVVERVGYVNACVSCVVDGIYKLMLDGRE